MSAPYLAIRALYIQHKRPEWVAWEDLVGFHLATPECYVLKGDGYFAMGRAVQKSATFDEIHDLTRHFPRSQCDAWHVWAFAGDMAKCISNLPYHLPWICLVRFGDEENELRFISTVHMRERLNG